jgi:hypothetical protein
MDNLETKAIPGTRHRTMTNKANTKEMSNTDFTIKRGLIQVIVNKK